MNFSLIKKGEKEMAEVTKFFIAYTQSLVNPAQTALISMKQKQNVPHNFCVFFFLVSTGCRILQMTDRETEIGQQRASHVKMKRYFIILYLK